MGTVHCAPTLLEPCLEQVLQATHRDSKYNGRSVERPYKLGEGKAQAFP